jgi:dTDP-4-amino-4,6-dideoxygalactose transaminase
MISLSDPNLGQEEKQALSDVIDSNWLTMGEKVKKFEKKFAKMHGSEGAVAVNSCTAGLHLSLLALGIGPGDEVLVPSLTFVATVNAIVYTGAKPVFVDIESINIPHISVEDAEAKYTSKTKAVIVMHYGGYLVDLPKWRSFADNYGLKLIEDAAHAPGIKGVGKLGDAAVFSFFSNKNMTTGEGGMILSDSSATLQNMRLLRAHGMTTNTLDRFRGHAFSYDVTTLGYNYRLDELRAALGIVQLAHLSTWNKNRKRLTDYYRKLIAEYLPKVSIPFNENQLTSAHLLPVLLPENVNKENVMEKLRQEGIQSSIHYPPVHTFSYYRNRFSETSLMNTNEFFKREVTLPLHPSLKKMDVRKIIQSLRKATN